VGFKVTKIARFLIFELSELAGGGPEKIFINNDL
jgi:hypothetical protein